jgi:hypothetical protein
MIKQIINQLDKRKDDLMRLSLVLVQSARWLAKQEEV